MNTIDITSLCVGEKFHDENGISYEIISVSEGFIEVKQLNGTPRYGFETFLLSQDYLNKRIEENGWVLEETYTPNMGMFGHLRKVSSVLFMNDVLSERQMNHVKGQFVTGISNYTNGGYDGKGILIAKTNDGIWLKYQLGHCSCYGPLEHGYTGKFTKDEILKLIDVESIGNAEKTLFREFVIQNTTLTINPKTNE